MAPTEILAAQHYKTLSELYDGTGICTELLTGQTRASAVSYTHLTGFRHTVTFIRSERLTVFLSAIYTPKPFSRAGRPLGRLSSITRYCGFSALTNGAMYVFLPVNTGCMFSTPRFSRSVSYTHVDVYKRQIPPIFIIVLLFPIPLYTIFCFFPSVIIIPQITS